MSPVDSIWWKKAPAPTVTGISKWPVPNGVPLAGGNKFAVGPLGTYYSANLTILQNWTTDDFLKVFHQGLDPKTNRVLAPVMPYNAYHGMSDADVASIGAYLKTLSPVDNKVPAAEPGPLAGVALHALPADSVASPVMDSSVAYGKYLVENVSACGSCHSPNNAQGQPIPGRALSGGGVNLGGPNTLYASPILGNVLTAEGYTKDSFIVALRTGVRPWGAKIPVQMPWMHFAYLTDNDLSAMWAYLQSQSADTAWPVAAVPTAKPFAAPGAATMAATMPATKAP